MSDIKTIPVIIITLFILALTLATSPGYANVSVGAHLKTTQNVTLRKSPPEKVLLLFTNSPGESVATIPTNQVVTVLEKKEIKTQLNVDIWIKISWKQFTGWAYYGTTAKAVNFK